MRHYSMPDQFFGLVATGLRALTRQTQATRPTPSAPQSTSLTSQEAKHSAGLMRINHTGEVCAQALYLSQSLLTRDKALKALFKQAAEEENDHLAWCQERLQALNSHTSYLNPLWFAGAFGIGLVAGCFGRQWNLGFLAATEEQVTAHLERHLQQLPATDAASRAVIEQMRTDEMQHADTAYHYGASPLPTSIQQGMQWTAKIMTHVAYYV